MIGIASFPKIVTVFGFEFKSLRFGYTAQLSQEPLSKPEPSSSQKWFGIELNLRAYEGYDSLHRSDSVKPTKTKAPEQGF